MSQNKSNLETPNRKPKNAVLEEFIKRAYEDSPGSEFRKQELLKILNAESFDEAKFISLVKEWNDKEESSKGFKGSYGEIDSISAKNGRLRVYHYLSSKSIKFDFIFKPITH